MKIERVKKLSPLDRFLYWIEERESVRLRKDDGKPRPWTDDEVIGTYRFCNVRRMDDRVSRWLLNNWYLPNKNHSNMVVAVSVARHFNLPNILDMIGFPRKWSPETIKDKIRCHKLGGNPVFNHAYMVRGNDGKDKVGSVMDYTIQPLYDDPPVVDTKSMQTTWGVIHARYGFGSFMAGQVVADLRWALSGSWKDRKKWAPIGPGSKRGMNRLLERPLESGIKNPQFEVELGDVIQICIARLDDSITHRLEAIDYQNCLCEFDKYERTLFDGRRPKSIYREHHANTD